MRELYSLQKNQSAAYFGSGDDEGPRGCHEPARGGIERPYRGRDQRGETEEGSCQGQQKRIMLIGDQIDDVAIIEAIEGTGAYLVMDDISIGSKMYWNDVDVTADPVQGIAERYLRKLKIPTTFVGTGDTYKENLEERFGHMRQYIEEFKVDGVILFVYKYLRPLWLRGSGDQKLHRIGRGVRALSGG